MRIRKCTRYIAVCGRGFLTKDACLIHEENCKCWTNPKNKACKTCRFGDYMPDAPDVGATAYWDCSNPDNDQEHSGAPNGIDYISANCRFYESLGTSQ